MPTLQKLLDAILKYQAEGNSLDADYTLVCRPMIGPDVRNVAPDVVNIQQSIATGKPDVVMVWN